MDNRENAIAQRVYGVEDALLIGLQEANENSINANFQLQRTIKNNDNQLCTYLCAANDDKAKISFVAGGSGNMHHAKVKALYESLEYSLSLQVLSKPQSEHIRFFTTLTSPSTSYLQENELLPKRLLQNKYINNQYPWLTLTHISKPANKLYYPLSLVYSDTPHLSLYPNSFNHDDIDELCNETGFSMGASREEAIIHGINEWVERDAYALFLLKTIIHNNPSPARIVVNETLTPDLLAIVNLIEQQYNEKLIIVDITTDISMPAFVVSFTRQDMLVQPLGFGASLCKHSALQQALLESLQYKDRFNDNARAFRQESFSYFASHPLIIKAMKCDLSEIIDSHHYVDVSWQSISTHSLSPNLKTQIALMVSLLAKQGADIYCCTLYQSHSGVTLTYTLITGLETFFLIKDAKFVPLKKRGLGVFNANEL